MKTNFLPKIYINLFFIFQFIFVAQLGIADPNNIKEWKVNLENPVFRVQQIQPLIRLRQLLLIERLLAEGVSIGNLLVKFGDSDSPLVLRTAELKHWIELYEAGGDQRSSLRNVFDQKAFDQEPIDTEVQLKNAYDSKCILLEELKTLAGAIESVKDMTIDQLKSEVELLRLYAKQTEALANTATEDSSFNRNLIFGMNEAINKTSPKYIKGILSASLIDSLKRGVLPVAILSYFFSLSSNAEAANVEINSRDNSLIFENLEDNLNVGDFVNEE